MATVPTWAKGRAHETRQRRSRGHWSAGIERMNSFGGRSPRHAGSAASRAHVGTRTLPSRASRERLDDRRRATRVQIAGVVRSRSADQGSMSMFRVTTDYAAPVPASSSPRAVPTWAQDRARETRRRGDSPSRSAAFGRANPSCCRAASGRGRSADRGRAIQVSRCRECEALCRREPPGRFSMIVVACARVGRWRRADAIGRRGIDDRCSSSKEVAVDVCAGRHRSPINNPAPVLTMQLRCLRVRRRESCPRGHKGRAHERRYRRSRGHGQLP